MNLNKLKGKIRECNLSQAEVARQMGIPFRTLNNKVRGINEFKVCEIMQLGEILEMSDDEKIEIFLS